MGKDVMEIIRSDYEAGMSFTLIEFHYKGMPYLMGSCVVPPDAEERKENIVFVFQDQSYQDFEEFQAKPILMVSEFLNWKNLLKSFAQGSSVTILC